MQLYLMVASSLTYVYICKHIAALCILAKTLCHLHNLNPPELQQDSKLCPSFCCLLHNRLVKNYLEEQSW